MAYEWFKMHSKGWLDGSIRQQLTMEERSVWADLLAFANESRQRGIIARAVGIPFTREALAARFEVPVEILNSTIAKCELDKNDPEGAMPDGNRLEVQGDGTIVISNWERYQAVPFHKLRETPKERDLRIEKQTRQYTRQHPEVVQDVVQHMVVDAMNEKERIDKENKNKGGK